MSQLNQSKELYKSYVSKLRINERFKNILGDEDFINENPGLYLYYPRLFSNIYPTEKNTLDNLCIAGYLYYISVLNLDRLIDDNERSLIPIISIAQEESIKLLTHIFGLDSEFWTIWDLRRSEYFKAVEIEKEIKTRKNISFEVYSNLADSKAAFGKVAIDSLFIYSRKNNTDVYNRLIESHRFFSIAYQFNDDVLDFVNDYNKGQFNWAVQMMKSNNESFEDIVTTKKLFYLNGYAKKLFLKAIDCLNNALRVLVDVQADIWVNEIKNLRQKFQTSIIETENYIEILTSEVYGSNIIKKKNTLAKGLRSGIDYIKSKQQSDGHWKEYVNQGGISDIWSTAFISSFISDNHLLKKLFADNLSSAGDFIEKNKIDKIWGYNKTWIEDADSTNFVLIFFLLNKIPIAPESIKRWLDFQKDDGTFSTYDNPNFLITSLGDDKIPKVDGWVQSHQCVSAVAFYYLVLDGKETSLLQKLKTEFSKFLENGLINSYWWTSNIYTYYFLAKSFHILNDVEKVKLILSKVKENLSIDGGIIDKYGGNLFYSGMALELLLYDKANFHIEIQGLLNLLLKKQYKDGSWENSHSLQIPDPSLLIHNSQKYPISTHGTSVRAKEYNRLFTTVSIIKSLSEYEKRTNGTNNI